jgi:hypothetical protein
MDREIVCVRAGKWNKIRRPGVRLLRERTGRPAVWSPAETWPGLGPRCLPNFTMHGCQSYVLVVGPAVGVRLPLAASGEAGIRARARPASAASWILTLRSSVRGE